MISFHVGADMFELPIVSATAAKSDILAQIRYPTGGKVVFDYEDILILRSKIFSPKSWIMESDMRGLSAYRLQK